MDLAGYNWLFPDRPTFALPQLETGGREHGSGWTTGGYIPPVLLKSIAWIESGWAQASYDPPVQYGQIGPVLSSHDCGYGITQVTSGMQNISGVPTLDQAMIGGHYAFNIARGARILADKWNAAPEFRPMVGIRNPSVIEDWYYALWGYNGFAFKNHPLNPDYAWPRPMYDCSSARTYPYQELIMGCAANPPTRAGVRLWNAQPVHLPNLSDPAFYDHLKLDNWGPCSQNLQCAAMDIPTPDPWNQDQTYPFYSRSQVFGDPIVALSNWNLEFVAPPSGQSTNQTIAIGNGGSGLLAWRLQTSAPWIQVSRIQGVSLGSDIGYAHQIVAIRADASSLLPGTYTGQITVETLWGTPATINVTVHTGDGALLNPSDGRIYLYQGGLKRHIPDPATFEANGFSWNKVISVPSDWAAALPTGQPLPSVLATGRLLRAPGNGVPTYVMENGAKRHVIDANLFAQCGYAWDSVAIVSSSTINNIPTAATLSGHPCPRVALPDGTLLVGTEGKVWVMRGNARRWVTSPVAFADCRYLWGNLNRVPDGLIAQFSAGPEVSGCTAEGSLILTPDGKVNVLLAGRAHHVPDSITFGAYGYDGNRITPVVELTAPPGQPVLSALSTGSLVRSQGDSVPVYVMDGGKKRHITGPDVFAACGYAWPAVAVLSPAAVDSIPTGSTLASGPCPRLPLPDATLIYGPDRAVWVTTQQTRKWVTGPSAMSDCRYDFAGLVPVSAALFAQFAPSQPVSSCTTPGSLLSRDGKIYLVVSDVKRHIPNPQTFEAAGLSWTAVTPLQQDMVTTGKPLLDVVATGRLIRASDQITTYVMENGRKRHVVSGAVLDACGYTWAAVSQVSAATIAGLPDGPQLTGAPCPQPTFVTGTLLVGSEGKVWVVHSGQRRWVINSSLYVACGYRWGDLNRVADSVINAVPPGPNLTAGPCP
jgi:hypothetical protein